MKNGQVIDWKQAWEIKKFRSLLIFGAVGLLISIIIWPMFLGHIEKRNGIILHDSLLVYLPTKDLSIFIFAWLWSAALLMLVRVTQQPKLFLQFLFSYWMLFIIRMITIQIAPLNPPIGLIALKDPISNALYGNGGVFITKDLFFSGHTATLFLIFLFLQKKWEKGFALTATILVGTMVLIQHIHYSIDVFFAPIFAFGIYWIVTKSMGNVFSTVKTQSRYKLKTETIFNK